MTFQSNWVITGYQMQIYYFSPLDWYCIGTKDILIVEIISCFEKKTSQKIFLRCLIIQKLLYYNNKLPHDKLL